MGWYVQDKTELNSILENFLNHKTKKIYENINGVIVPHAGYEFSGKVAGKSYSFLKAKRVLILAPNHYDYFKGVLTHNEKYWQTPLGKISVIESDFKKINLKQEHSIDNQIPFLQKIGVEEILPLSVGKVSLEEAKEIANKIKNFNGKFVVSTDLSHFHEEKEANLLDKRTIELIENLDMENYEKIDACGVYPLIVLMQLCKIKNWKPKLLEYKTSGSITDDFSNVVGYAGFVF
jgi:hypothetical protein